MERDNKTPYTGASYNRWRWEVLSASPAPSLLSSWNEAFFSTPVVAPRSVATFAAEVIRAVFAALEADQGNVAVTDLWKFSKVMTRPYGAPSHEEESDRFALHVSELISEVIRAEAHSRSLRGGP